MKQTTECIATLHAVLARLESNPRSTEEWKVIQAQLKEAQAYAEKCYTMRLRIEGNDPEIQIYRAQQVEDALAKAEERSPRLIARVEDIPS